MVTDGMVTNFLRTHGYESEGWATDGLGTLICPCGQRVEPDGQCPDGHISPLRQEGYI